MSMVTPRSLPRPVPPASGGAAADDPGRAGGRSRQLPDALGHVPVPRPVRVLGGAPHTTRSSTPAS